MTGEQRMARMAGPLKRRGLLAGAAAFVAALAGKGAAPERAEAGHGLLPADSLHLGQFNEAPEQTRLRSPNGGVLRLESTGGSALTATSNITAIDAETTGAGSVTGGTGVRGVAWPDPDDGRGISGNVGVTGSGRHGGVFGHSRDGYGIQGEAFRGVGVLGNSGRVGVFGACGLEFEPGELPPLPNGQFGVVGNGTGAGVRGDSAAGDGAVGISTTGRGVRGASRTQVGVFGAAGNDAASQAPPRGLAGVVGQVLKGIGVHGRSTHGIGVVAESQTGAPLRLIPKATVGPPTTGLHEAGELWFDRVGNLFICTVRGTPGTWRRVPLV